MKYPDIAMPIFNVIDGSIFLKRKGTRVNVALKPEMIPKRYEGMPYGYIIMSNVMLDPNCTEEPLIIESVSSISFHPSPKIGSINILDGDEWTDTYDYLDIIKLNGVAYQKWSDYTLPAKLSMLKNFERYLSDFGKILEWCDKTDLPPFHIFRYLKKDMSMLYGLDVILTDDESFLGKEQHELLLKEQDDFIDSYKTKIGKYLRGVLSKETKMLDETQMSCVLSAQRSGITIITGGPGTGKTKVSGSILREWSNCLVTWRATALAEHAVKRIRESFSTHPRFSGNFCNMDNLKRSQDRFNVTHLLVDEMSMVNTYSFAALLRLFPSLVTLVLVGDVDQLDPVGCGRPYERMIQTKKHFRLLKNYRMKEERYTFVHVTKVPEGAVYLHPFRSDQKNGSMTIHKAQGSEYDTVVLGTSAPHLTRFSKNRKLVYTAVTRSKSSVVYLMGPYKPEIVEQIMYGEQDDEEDGFIPECDEW